MSNSVTIKNVNIYPIKGQKVYEISPPLIGICTDVDLNTLIIRRIIKSGHKVEENLPDGRKIVLNLENFECDNTVERPIMTTIVSSNTNSELVDKLVKSESTIKELNEKIDNQEGNYREAVASYTSLLNAAKSESLEKDKKIKELTEENVKLKEEVNTYEELSKEEPIK